MVNKFIIYFVVFLGLVLFYMSTGLGFRYYEVIGEPETRAIKHRFSDEFAVKPAIIDYKIENGYVYGFRLPSYEVSCKNGKYSSLMLKLTRLYFIFNLADESYVEFTSESEFYKHVGVLGLEQSLYFSSEQHNETVEKYRSRYETFEFYKSCVPKEI